MDGLARAAASFLAQGHGAAPDKADEPEDRGGGRRHDHKDEVEDVTVGDIDDNDDVAVSGIMAVEGGDEEARPRRLWLGQYRQFEIVEANRQLGEQVRQEEALHRRRRDASITAYNEMRVAKNAEARGQQAMTDQAMREAWTSKTLRVSAAKAELEANRDKAQRQKQAWAASGHRARALEVAQKRKIYESKAKVEVTRRTTVLRTKQETSQRRSERRLALDDEWEARKRMIDKLRKEESHSEGGGVAEAREYMGRQKREAAAEVRTTISQWQSDRKRAEGVALERAAQSRAGALSSRRHAQNNRATVVVSRHQQAVALRERLKALDVERKQMVLATATLNHQRRTSMYEARYASRSATEEVQTSAYGSLVAATRVPQRWDALSSTGSRALLGGAPEAATVVTTVDSLAGPQMSPMGTVASGDRGGTNGNAAATSLAGDAPCERPKACATVITASGAAKASAVSPSGGAALFDKPNRVGAKGGGTSTGGDVGAKGGRPTRYRPQLLTVKTVGWTGKGREAPGNDLTVDINGATTVGQLKDRIRTCRAAWAHLPSMSLLYKGHLVNDETAVDDSWTKSFVVAMESRTDAAEHALVSRLRHILDAQYTRVIDMFRSWDDDNSGTISAVELRRALLELGDTTPVDHIDALFATLDQTHDGLVDYRELRRVLRAHAAPGARAHARRS